MTQTGLSLGTPQYMSPEQATADRVVDGRTDIFSLGAMTYEMLAGDPPHVASTSQAVIAKLLTEKPAGVRTHRPNVPPHVEAAIAHALEKLPADRCATAKEFADELEGRTTTTSVSYAMPAAVPVATAANRRRELLGWGVAAALAVFGGWETFKPRAQAELKPIRVNFDLPAGQRVNDVLVGNTIAIAPQGDVIAFTTTSQAWFRMYVRRTDELAPHEIARLAGRNLIFSPDGRQLAFSEGNEIKKVSIDGGDVKTITNTRGAVPYGLTWSKNDSIFIGTFSGMFTTPISGGDAALVANLNGQVQTTQVGMRWPLVLPRQDAIAFTAGSSSNVIGMRLGIYMRKSREIKTYDVPMSMALGVVDDWLIYVSPAGGLMALRVDRSYKPIGDPVQLDENVLVDPTTGVKASLSASGTLVYLKGRALFQPTITKGAGDTGTAVLKESGSYSTPRFSPDGGRIAMSMFGSGSSDIWIYDVGRHTPMRLTSEGLNLRPEWTADGKNIVFISTRAGKVGIWKQPADASGPAELLDSPEYEPFEAMLSPDEQWLIYRTAPGSKYPRDILAVSMKDKHTIPLVTGPYAETMPRLSPDGRWLVYQSNESGRFEIYMRPFPNNGARTTISDNGGSEAIWDHSGHAIYYRGPNGEVVKVEINTSASTVSLGKQSVLLTGDYLTDSSHPNWDVALDGRMLLLKRSGPESQTIVVHNWTTELRAKLAKKN
jgi:serine/threonine-protein kinase